MIAIPVGPSVSAVAVRRVAARALATVLLALAAPAAQTQGTGLNAAFLSTVNDVLESQRSGVPYRWTVAATGERATITAARAVFRDDGTPCRDYVLTIEAPDSERTIRGTGCRIGERVWTLATTRPAAAPATEARRSAPTPSTPSLSAGRPPAAAAPFAPPLPGRKPLLIAAVLPTPTLE